MCGNFCLPFDVLDPVSPTILYYRPSLDGIADSLQRDTRVFFPSDSDIGVKTVSSHY